MAKRNTTTRTRSNGNGTSKAEAIRQYKAAHPDAGPSEIAEALTKKGVEVIGARSSGGHRGQSHRGQSALCH
ncbi:MAG TPA: hypothetical protein VMY37_29245 [Thermoguttaceae bacterium]|nr:hypothetical protein [Thermoguttaceae bacterium]